MKLYKNSWKVLENDLKKCAANYGTYKIRYIGIYAVLGDILLLKIDGRLCHFEDRTNEFIKWV
ncbi:hypothetical protein [Psychrobacillus sp. FSL K6-1464]|uniref:hypothetical protein n=1 Tax=Psychrobacillus sp. FSL K6-1464 TaxID=2921545 RepID=UPI0030F6A488